MKSVINTLVSFFRLLISFRRLAVILVAAIGLAGCNDEVFVEKPRPDQPENPDSPEIPDVPEITDSLMFVGIDYEPESLVLVDEPVVDKTSSTFTNFSSAGNMTVLFDSYNNSIVRFYNSTYYVTPWAQTPQAVDVPGLNADLVPGFYGDSVVFKWGTQSLPRQFMAGHTASKYLPQNASVKASITVTRRIVRASGTLYYRNLNSTSSVIEQSAVNVEVWVPVDIKVEWSDITYLQ